MIFYFGHTFLPCNRESNEHSPLCSFFRFDQQYLFSHRPNPSKFTT
ncbi:hypothetical protein D5E88_07825 [Vibrio parahaemolyticus]|nr:hypothetical protein [Vibrio parahaemolyticus]EGQ8532367.1 hypothetical protein [Vibrio parahaemolyticus]EGQ9820284.1 hypothetical protein [Vibrio parahaemolyticus]TBT11281.1 hypothetical protein D5E88_07825 [Vibrio parahaemolyticus]TBT74522.1 hypothetical protein D5E74_00510 [Vibrio parahaemolyticus]